MNTPTEKQAPRIARWVIEFDMDANALEVVEHPGSDLVLSLGMLEAGRAVYLAKVLRPQQPSRVIPAPPGALLDVERAGRARGRG